MLLEHNKWMVRDCRRCFISGTPLTRLLCVNTGSWKLNPRRRFTILIKLESCALFFNVRFSSKLGGRPRLCAVGGNASLIISIGKFTRGPNNSLSFLLEDEDSFELNAAVEASIDEIAFCSCLFSFVSLLAFGVSAAASLVGVE